MIDHWQDGDTALTYAAKGKNTKLGHLLLEAKADVNVKTKGGYTVPPSWVAELLDDDIAKKLIDAVSKNDAPRLNQLIGSGLNVNAQTVVKAFCPFL